MGKLINNGPNVHVQALDRVVRHGEVVNDPGSLHHTAGFEPWQPPPKGPAKPGKGGGD